MVFETRAFGPIEIPSADILEFPEGIFAFEKLRRYALLPTKSGASFFWLQSLEESKLAFLIAEVKNFTNLYEPRIAQSDLAIVATQNIREAEIWGIVTVPPDKPQDMTINLQGPVLINRHKQLGGQFISEDETHGVRVSVLALLQNAGKI